MRGYFTKGSNWLQPRPPLQPQTQLAQKINAKQKSTFRYETEVSLPSVKTLVKIAKVLKNQLDIFWMNKVKRGVSYHNAIEFDNWDLHV